VLKALFADSSPDRAHHGWPRVAVDLDVWRAIGEALREGKLDLLGLWGDVGAVQCVMYEPATRQITSASLDARAGRVPSLALFTHRASAWSARPAICSASSLPGFPIPRPWLDHGRWPLPSPARRIAAPRA